MEPQSIRCRQAGFTLVELAVVMIIIGLLIGGVLKGQELIANAQVTSSVSQMKGFDAAISTFRDSYAAVPGDMATAQARLPSCTAALNCTNGNGNNRIDTQTAGVAPTAIANESAQVWRHLSAADLLSGTDSSGVMVFGQGLPEASIGGGYFLGFHAGTGTLPGQAGGGNPRGGHYIALTGSPTVNVGAAGSAVVKASQASRIDRKMDDGSPDTGSVLAAQEGGGNCVAAGIYNEAVDPIGCALYIRIQQ